MSKVLATSRFQEIIETIEELSIDDQEILLEIAKKHLIEQKRSRLVSEIKEAQEAYRKGEICRGTVDDFMKDLGKMRDIYFYALFWKENDIYVSYCPQLDISSCGDTLEDARRMLKEAVLLFIEEAEKKGTLQEIFEESDYHFEEKEQKWQPPILIATELMSVSTD